MRFDSTRFASPRQESSSSIVGVILYLEAIGCARFSPIELMLVANAFINGWIRPRFLDGERKVRPIKLSPSELSAKTGFLRTRIQETMKSLRIANVLLQDETGLWRLNPRWQDWMDKKGRPRIPSLYHEFILDVLSEVERSPFRVAWSGTTLPPNGDFPPLTLPPNGDAPPPNGVVALSSDGDTSDPRAISPRARPEELPCITLSQRETTEALFCVCANRIQNTGVDTLSTGAHARDSDCAEPISHTHTQESECKPACTEEPGEEKSPEPGTVSSPLSLEASNPDPTQDNLPAVHPNNHDHTHTLDDDGLDAQIAKFGSAFPGTCVPDEEILAKVRRLSHVLFPMNDNMLDGIARNRFRFPSAWILKAFKRAWLVNPSIRNFSYVYVILKNWDALEATDRGMEDDFDDAMQPLPAKPQGAKVPDDRRPAQPESSTEEKNAKFQESFSKLYPHLVGPVPAHVTARFRGPEPEGYVPVFRTTIERTP